MEIGMIGLGRMGTNMVGRLLRAQHRCVVYDLHPEAFTDIDEIAIYIGQDSSEAAHRVVDEILPRYTELGSFPAPGTPPYRSDQPAAALYPRAGLSDRLRAG